MNPWFILLLCFLSAVSALAARDAGKGYNQERNFNDYCKVAGGTVRGHSCYVNENLYVIRP
jgi:hypothetical protein